MEAQTVKVIFRRANLVFPGEWSDFQVAFGSLWSAISMPALAERIAAIVDVMSDDQDFVPFHHEGMREMYCVVQDLLTARVAGLASIPAGLGVGHRQVVSEFYADPFLLTRAPQLSVEDEVLPVESPYVA